MIKTLNNVFLSKTCLMRTHLLRHDRHEYTTAVCTAAVTAEMMAAVTYTV